MIFRTSTLDFGMGLAITNRNGSANDALPGPENGQIPTGGIITTGIPPEIACRRGPGVTTRNGLYGPKPPDRAVPRTTATMHSDVQLAAPTNKGDLNMLGTLQRDRRTRRQSQFHLEALDDRIVLSAAAAGAAAESAAKAAVIEHRQEVRIARHEEVLARREARHEAKVARVEARHEAKLAFIAARSGAPTPNAALAVTNPTAVSGSASNSASVNTTGAAAGTTMTATPAIVTMPSNSTNPGQLVPQYPITTTATGTGTGTATTTGSSTTSPGPLPANVSASLQALYQEYKNAGGGSSFTPSLPSDHQLQISGTDVGVSLKVSASGDFNTTLAQLKSDGLQVSTSSSTYGIIDGMLPIAELPTVATMVAAVTPEPPPILM